MKIWLTGARGLLGQALLARLGSSSLPVVATDRELDVGDRDAVADHGGRGFSHIINCAAFTAVDAAEARAEEAFAVNARGAANLAELARRIGAHLVHISTDYVFDGRSATPYREDDVCAPLGIYGQSKLAGERSVLTTMEPDGARRVQVVRTSWLFGEGGRSFVATMLRLMGERAELRVVADQQGRPTYAVDLAEVLIRLAGIAGGPPAPSGLYHFANANPTSWYAFAEQILTSGRRLGLPLVTERIRPITSAELALPAPRPAYSVLNTDRIASIIGPPRPWQDALEKHLDRSRA